MADKAKRKLNTGNAALFASIVKQVGGSPVSKDTAVGTNTPVHKDTSTTQTQEEQLQITDQEGRGKEEPIRINTPAQNTHDAVKTEEQKVDVNTVEKSNQPIQNNTPTVQTKEEQPQLETGDTKDYSKKENEFLKKFLSKRKSKGRTSPILVDDSIKEKIDTISTLFGTTTTSFVCNIFEEHFKEHKNIYMELYAKKKPFML